MQYNKVNENIIKFCNFLNLCSNLSHLEININDLKIYLNLPSKLENLQYLDLTNNISPKNLSNVISKLSKVIFFKGNNLQYMKLYYIENNIDYFILIFKYLHKLHSLSIQFDELVDAFEIVDDGEENIIVVSDGPDIEMKDNNEATSEEETKLGK